MNSTTVFSEIPERVRVLSMDGEPAYWADAAEYKRLVKQGFATGSGTFKKHEGVYLPHRLKVVRLTVPLAVATGQSGTRVAGRQFQPGDYAGQRYVKKSRSESGFAYFEHKSLKGVNAAHFAAVIHSATAEAEDSLEPTYGE